MAQLLLPDSDISAGPWGTPMWSAVDADDGTDVTCNSTGVGIVGLSNPGPPTAGSHILRWNSWISKSGSTMVCRLYQGGSVIASSGNITVTSGQAQSYTLSAGEVSAITDYADLRIGMEVTSYGGKGAVMHWVYAALEVPDAPFEGSEFMAYNGSIWVPGKLKRWDGAQWVPAQVQRFNGATWEDVP